MSAGSKAAGALAPAAAGYVRTVLDKAIDGVGPLRSVARSADGKLVDAHGDVEKAVTSFIRSHAALAGLQGFVTNLGGVVSFAWAIPANVAGVTLVQCHLVAGIAHLRGYDLDDPRVRNAILTCLLGSDEVESLVRKGKLPSGPMALATSPAHDPELDKRIASEVTKALVGRTAGRRAVTLVAKRVPGVGGAVGASSDAWSTYQIAQYASSELRSRRHIQSPKPR